MSSPTPLDQEDVAFRCLCEFVQWHFETDQTELAPIGEGSYGKFLSLPFEKWLGDDRLLFSEEEKEWNHHGYKPSSFLMSCAGMRSMTPSLLKRLIGPSQPDVGLPPLPFSRGKSVEYRMSPRADSQEPEFAKVSYKGMIAASLQWFMYECLCEGRYDLLTAFHHPALMEEIPEHLQLAIGVMREVMIIPQFGSMRNFWLAHARLIEEGGHEIGYLAEDIFTPISEVFDLLQDDQDAVKMLRMLVDIGIDDERFADAFYDLCIHVEE